MTDFKDIQNSWNQQNEATGVDPQLMIKKVKKQAKALKSKHVWTQAILFITCAVLIVFFVLVQAWRNNTAAIALSIMTAVVFIRLVLEIISLRKFQKIKITEDFEKHKVKKVKFYQWRKRVHFVLTPLILVLYFVSFDALMPIFRRSLSAGMYLYIQISTPIVFIGLCLMIGFQIKKELGILKFFDSFTNDKEE